ncbi:MAG: hypothetical protein Fues2KO_22950 [Fuerstiella sp.]
MTLFRLTVASIFAIPASCTAQTLTESQDAEFELPRQAIVFVHHSDAGRRDYDLWQIAADGTQLASVLTLPGRQTQFTISPDGNHIVYVDSVEDEDGDRRRSLFRRAFQGGERTQIGSDSSNNTSPVWSPDGQQLLFASDRDSKQPELYLYDFGTEKTQRVTQNEWHESPGGWSPDGRKILFTRYLPADEDKQQDGRGAIVELTLSDRSEQVLTQLSGYCGSPSFSPDGRQIAFHRTADSGSELWLMDADGGNARAITDSFVDEYSPAWSPDGQWIVYTAGTGQDGHGTFDLWLIRPDGSDRRLVTAAANTQMSPQFRPGDSFLLGR